MLIERERGGGLWERNGISYVERQKGRQEKKEIKKKKKKIGV